MTKPSAGLEAPFALARFHDVDRVQDGERAALGLVAGERIRPLSVDELGTDGLAGFLADPDWNRLEDLASAEGPWRDLDSVVLTAPIEPGKVLQAGANYRTHVVQLVMAGLHRADSSADPEVLRAKAEKIMDARADGEPFIFIGLPQCVVGTDQPLRLPAYSETHDWEIELAVVIGRPAFRVDRTRAMDHVAAYTIVNDITTRDLVFPADVGDIGADWYRAKNAPGFLPTGPFLVPAPFVDPTDISIQLSLNGEIMQDATTAELIFDVPALVSAASQTTTLNPGDILLTGSPAGNGQHWKRFLRDGDVMSGSVAGLGTQVVRCVAEAGS